MPVIHISYLDSGNKEDLRVSQKKFIIGRSTKADVVISREEFSRFHCEIDCEQDTHFVTDLNSTNGVFINGEKITKGERVPYQLIFPIEIAGKVSISISLDEDQSSNRIEQSSAKNFLEPNFSSETRTHVQPKAKKLKENPPPRFKKTASKELDSKATQFKIVTVLALLIMGYFSYNHFQGPPSFSDGEMENEKSIQTPPFVPLKNDSLNFKEFFSLDKCEAEPEFCKTLKEKSHFDKLYLDKDKLVLFINISTLVRSLKLNEMFLKLSESQQNAVFLSRPAGNPLILAKIKELNLSHFIIVNFNNLDSQVLFKNFVQVDFLGLMNKSKPSLVYFSDYYFGGMDRGFNKFIKPYVFYSDL
jgi:pSer/pThr/pTyr-binding forkhead associated (FHA) protein